MSEALENALGILSEMSEAKKMKGKDPCWDGYEMVGTKKKNGKEVPNCVPKNEEVENVEEGSTGWHPQSSEKNPNFNNDLSGRRVSPPGKRLKSGDLDYNERTSQERLKAIMKFTKNTGGLAGPKGKLPEEVELEEEQLKYQVRYAMRNPKLGGKIYVAHYADEDMAKKFLDDIKKKGGNGMIKAVDQQKEELDQLFTEAMKKEKEETSKKKVIKKGEKLSGKQEVVKVHPEIPNKN